MTVSNIISLLSGVSLFLFGMTLMGDGLKKVAGNKLELVLYKLTNSAWKGILLGTGVTAVIQSSSATSVMVVGFVNSGMMVFRQAIGIILGSILGTSITGWIICLSDLGGGGGWLELVSTATITGLVAVIGIVLRMFSKNKTKNHAGDILLGFAVLMFGMSAMSGAVAPLKESEKFISILMSFSNPILGVLVGAAFTAIIQSASAAVGILQALAITGAIDFEIAFPIILGIAIGASVPVLLSAVGANLGGRRTAFVYLFISAVGAAVTAIVFYSVNAIHPLGFFTDKMTTVSIAALNTVFRLATVLLLAPLISIMEKLICRIIKALPKNDGVTSDIDRLEERFIKHPTLAIEQCRSVINTMAKKAQDNLHNAIELVNTYSDDGFNKVESAEDDVDKYEDGLGTYLMKVSAVELTKKQNEDISKYLHTLSDFERISDHSLNIAETAKEISEKKVVFSAPAAHELTIIQNAVTEIVSIAINAFINNDLELASKVEPLEDIIDDLCDEMKLHHVDRLQKGMCTLNQGFVFNDLLTNYERVSDHCSNIAVAMIELESDEFDTHEYLNSLTEIKQDAFDKYHEEFKVKYSI